MLRWSLGTSMPTVVLPGIGATIRTLGTARAIARSSARLMILRDAQAGLELDLELGDHRAGVDLDDADLVAEVEQGPLQQHGPGVDLGLVLLDREGGRRARAAPSAAAANGEPGLHGRAELARIGIPVAVRGPVIAGGGSPAPRPSRPTPCTGIGGWTDADRVVADARP